jgi:hypothetical protein
MRKHSKPRLLTTPQSVEAIIRGIVAADTKPQGRPSILRRFAASQRGELGVTGISTSLRRRKDGMKGGL